jgi:hypothetical protein
MDYLENGRYDVDKECDYDLVEKYELKLEVGKTYRNREGKEVKIVKFAPGDNYPFVDSDDWSYTENGRFSPPAESRHDLLEEIKEEKQELKLEVGKTYRTRADDLADTVVKVVEFVLGDTHPYKGDNYMDYVENGRYDVEKECDCDLVEEVKVEKVEKNNQKQGLKLEVGKTYETRAGKHVTVTIVSHDPNNKFYPYTGSNSEI